MPRSQLFWLSFGFILLAWLSLQAILTQVELHQLRSARARAEQEIETLKKENQQRLRELYALQKDPFLIEQRLREETGKTRPSETPLELPARSNPQ